MTSLYIWAVTTFIFLLLLRDSKQLYDPCRWKKHGTVRSMAGDCGGYWECVGGKSARRCCAPGYGFGYTRGQYTCVRYDKLTIPCENSSCATQLRREILEEEDCIKNKKLDLVLLVDGSGSITAKGLHRIISLISTTLQSFSNQVPRFVRVGLVIFDRDPYTLFSLNKFSKLTDILASLKNVTFMGGGTRTDLALNFAKDEIFTPEAGDRDGADNALLVITDGKSSEPKETETAAKFVKFKGIHVFAMSVGEEANQKELAAIVSDAIYRITDQFFVDIGSDFLCFLAQKICQKPLDCPFEQVDGYPRCFQPKGSEYMTDIQECPEGLYFSEKTCACEQALGEEVHAINYCLPTVKMDMHRNLSMNFEALGIELIAITLMEVEGKPEENYFDFNGNNSFINIIRLSNTYKVPQVLLSFDIKVGSFDKRQGPQTIFTNHLGTGKACDGLHCEGSIQVLIVAQNRLQNIVITKAGKKISLETSISIGWNRVWFVYDGSFSQIFLVMTFERTHDDYKLKDAAHDNADGPLAPRQSGLLVGRPSSDKSGTYFSGGLTNFIFSHCLPEKIEQQLQFLFSQ